MFKRWAGRDSFTCQRPERQHVPGIGRCRSACPPGCRVSAAANWSWSRENNLRLPWSHLPWKLMPLVSSTEDRRPAVEGLFAWSESVFNLQLAKYLSRKGFFGKFSIELCPAGSQWLSFPAFVWLKNRAWVEQTFKSASPCVVIHQEVSSSWCVTTGFWSASAVLKSAGKRPFVFWHTLPVDCDAPESSRSDTRGG